MVARTGENEEWELIFKDRDSVRADEKFLDGDSDNGRGTMWVLLINSLIIGHLCYFYVLAFMSNTAINKHGHTDIALISVPFYIPFYILTNSAQDF